MSWIYLSHYLSEESPGFGGSSGFSRTQTKSISSGDSSNSFEFRMPNHHGTHIDLPKHFVDTGNVMNDISAGEFVFSKVGLLSISPKENELLNSSILEIRIPTEIELLLFKTNWSLFRAQEKYWKNNPGFS